MVITNNYLSYVLDFLSLLIQRQISELTHFATLVANINQFYRYMSLASRYILLV